MFFLATADAEGRPNCSYKGGDPGFVRVVDETHARVPELRRQRHVPVDRQHAHEPARGACCSSTSRRGKRMRVNGTASIEPRATIEPRVPGGAVHRQSDGARGVSELPALHPQVSAGGAIEVRAERRRFDADAGVETLRLGERRPAEGRSGEGLKGQPTFAPGFTTHTLHQPFALTSLPGKRLHGRHSSPSLPVSCRQFGQVRPGLYCGTLFGSTFFASWT